VRIDALASASFDADKHGDSVFISRSLTNAPQQTLSLIDRRDDKPPVSPLFPLLNPSRPRAAQPIATRDRASVHEGSGRVDGSATRVTAIAI
jgi:hypothetical protein